MFKSAVYSGNLEKISASKKTAHNTWHYEYIRFAGQRWDNIHVSNYINDDFQDAVGSEISISTFALNAKNPPTILALRIGEKIERVPPLSGAQALSITIRQLLVMGPVLIVWYFLLVFALLIVGFFLSTLLGGLQSPIWQFLLYAVPFCYLFHKFLISKTSNLGMRAAFNEAAGALDKHPL
jgi:hypothetical protein